MYISKLSIRNYRNFEKTKFNFKKGVNTIIGENGSGKTNVFRAMRYLIDNSMPRQLYFSEKDFNRSITDIRGHWIIISIDLAEVDKSEETQLFVNHSCAKEDGTQDGSYTMFFRPKKGIREDLFKYSQKANKNKKGLEDILSKIEIDIDPLNKNGYEVVFTCRSNSDFTDESIYNSIVGDFNKIVFPDPENYLETLIGSPPPRMVSFPKEVSCTFIKALRDVESDMKSVYKNPLLKLLKHVSKDFDKKTSHEISDSISGVNKKITSLEQIKNLKEGIKDNLNSAIGATYSPEIEIRSEYSDSMSKIMQSLKLWAGDSDDTELGELKDLSLGGANILYLAMKLLEYETIQTEDSASNFLLIEEPEAHIHTHIQKTFFDNMRDKKTQVFISTHSTHISSVAKIGAMNILQREINKSLVFDPSNELKEKELVHLERYLDSVRTNLLFAKGVVLVEGDAEEILIPAMFKKSFGISLDEIGISIINIRSTGFENVANIFHEDRIRKKCSIVTDNDISIYKSPAIYNEDDDSKEAKNERLKRQNAKNSEIKGIKRIARLEKKCKDNEYVEPFLTEHTFEVSFIEEDNSEEITLIVETLYKNKKNRIKAKTELESADVSIYGNRVLSMAKKEGKGWFALLLAENLFYNTNIPNYILKAISFATKSISDKAKVKMIKYVITEMEEAKHDTNSFDKNSNDVILEFKNKLPNQQLTKFLGLI